MYIKDKNKKIISEEREDAACIKNKKIILKGKDLVNYKKTLKLTDIQREIIIGTLLGDSSISKQKTKSYNIKFEQSIKNKEYIYHLYFIFKDWVGTEPKIRNIKGGNAFDRQSIWFRTYRHKNLNYYYNEFYFENKKRIPKLIHRYLTPRVLAYWFMDDGTKTKKSYVFNTQCFCLRDQNLLLNALTILKLNCSLHKDKDFLKIYIKVVSKRDFTLLIKPFILPCFFYKLHNIE